AGAVGDSRRLSPRGPCGPPFAKLAESCPSALPLLPHHRAESAAYPRFEALQHRGRLTVPEVSEPASQISRDLLDHPPQADAAGSPGLFPNPKTVAVFGERRIPALLQNLQHCLRNKAVQHTRNALTCALPDRPASGFPPA